MENLKDKPWHQLPAEEVVQFLGVNSSTGLSADEVRHRQKEFGPNRLTAQKRQSELVRFLLQFHQPQLKATMTINYRHRLL
jgi:magnesium-transporting ATPase (P-type)